MPKYKKIRLTKGYTTLVDPADYIMLTQWNWCAHESSKGKVYAVRKEVNAAGHKYNVYMHRQLLGLKHGDKLKGDHRNTKATLDNRRAKLRVATSKQNAYNQRMRSTNTTGFKGIEKSCNGWKATIKVNGKKLYLGYRSTKKAAAELYSIAAIKYHGNFVHSSSLV